MTSLTGPADRVGAQDKEFVRQGGSQFVEIAARARQAVPHDQGLGGRIAPNGHVQFVIHDRNEGEPGKRHALSPLRASVPAMPCGKK